MIVELTVDGLRGCRGTGPGCLMYPASGALYTCPSNITGELVCNTVVTSTRFVDKQEYLTWKLTK